MTFKFTVIISLLALVSLSADASSQFHLRLFHRLYHPITGSTPFTERGIVTSTHTDVLTFQPSLSFQNDFRSFAETVKARVAVDAELFLYQIALEQGKDNVEAQWDISSVKTCQLPFATTETIYLHYIDAQDPVPHALDYFVTPTPHDGSCSKSRPGDAAISFQFFAENVNTTVISRMAPSPPVPTLISPLPFSPEGDPIKPVPEKTFLQKYWMYMLALVIFSMFAGGPEEEEGRKQE